ncbi:MAG: hypothetical protein EOP51_04455 [Sphingobacteriales bacterium]|nr:MAG: hypothetical protein EOP51_04455 [Sphingobacteriales bacterium]
MEILLALASQLWAIGDVFSSFRQFRYQRTKDYNKAIQSIREALHETEYFLRNPDFGNRDRTSELAKLWSRASSDIGIVNKDLGQMLDNKSNFWNNPESYIEVGTEVDVIKLEKIREEIRSFYLQR